MNSARGSISILVAAAIVLCGLLCVQIGRLDRAPADKARAETAADAAALAAATALRDGDAPNDVRSAARRTAEDNGAHLLTCRCAGTDALVTVAVGPARAIARAAVTNGSGGP